MCVVVSHNLQVFMPFLEICVATSNIFVHRLNGITITADYTSTIYTALQCCSSLSFDISNHMLERDDNIFCRV